MKHILVFFCLFSLLTGLQAQNGSKKYLTLEHFTNTRCGICGAANPGFYTKLFAFQGQYHHMTIHPSYPYNSCLLYLANTTENTARSSYYANSSTPTIFFNGLTKRGASQVTTAMLDAELNKFSPIEVVVRETGTTSRTVNIEVKTTGQKPSGNYKVFAAILEKELQYASPNGEKVHYNVFRKFASNMNGDPISLANSGSSVQLNYTYEINSAWKEDQMYILVWVQHETTKEILNSGTKFDLVSSTDNFYNSDFTVFPNPIKDEIKVNLNKNFSAPIQFKLRSILGNQIKAWTIKSGQENITIPAQDIRPGIYLLEVSVGSKKYTRKLFKE